MSDPIHHECGIAMIRLMQPLSYYQEKYGTPLYGFNKLFLLMEKQHNRGQDGAGIGACKLDVPVGKPFMFRERSVQTNSLSRIFNAQLDRYNEMVREGTIHPEFVQTVREHFEFGAEVMIGHLRYGTSGSYSLSNCHPYFRRSNWPIRNLMLVGNFNMTNTRALNEGLIARGQHPIFDTDTQTILEEIGFQLDQAHRDLSDTHLGNGYSGPELQNLISEQLDLGKVLRAAAQPWDGGYVIGGMIGNGDSFVMRDGHGIRPCFYYRDYEVAAFASERAALMTIFNVPYEAVRELKPGHVAVIKRDGSFSEVRFTDPAPRKSCSFERIYFSRGNDTEIYAERKRLGAALGSRILKGCGGDFKHTIFGYIPNTAETAYYGLMREMRQHRRRQVKAEILRLAEEGGLTEAKIDELMMTNWPRSEKIANKDIKLRTFISQEKGRAQLVSHVYDLSYGIVKPQDTLVVIDDSIVRGTTLRESIIKMLSRTQPKKIIIASTAPQIRYPDCYGIDMSELGKFIAFQAVVTMLKESGRGERLTEVYQAACEELKKPAAERVNVVKQIYADFTEEEISTKIAEMVRPRDEPWEGELEVIFQSVDALHEAVPEHTGDWYFTGDYPTPGGMGVVNRAYVNYYENREGRSY
ncbi:MAG: amidophosphoribosyltransferase [Verrucomicrobiota bacterium]